MPLIRRDQAREINKGRLVDQGIDYPEDSSLSSKQAQQLRDKVLADARQSGEGLIKQSQQKAEQIKNEALQQADNIKEKARKEGLQIGKEEAAQEMSGHIKESLKVIDQAREETKKIMKDTETDILRLSIKVANQLMKHEITLNPDIIMNVVRDAITKISDNRDIILRVNQDDLDYVRGKKELLEELMDTRNLTITADRKIEQGGCMMETKLGFIDAKVSTKSEMILNALLAVYSKDKDKQKSKELREIAGVDLSSTNNNKEIPPEDQATDGFQLNLDGI